tara:strand:- start:161 stop:679 length:519 start_codon:yes stop_codon:yes gene_type:complete
MLRRVVGKNLYLILFETLDYICSLNPLIMTNVHDVNISENKVARLLWFTTGIIVMSIGFIGVVVPGLPTTPLMILAAACFAKSSQRLYDWIINNKMFGKHVINYREGKGIPKKVKPIILTTMWIFVIFAIFVGIPKELLIAKISTFALALIGTIFIIRLPSITDSKPLFDEI